MKLSKSYFYLIVVAVIAIVVFFLEGPLREKRGDVLDKPFLENFNKEKVARIEIEHLLNGAQLKMENGKWLVANLKTKLKEEIEKQKSQEPRTKNQEPKWFQADDERIDVSLTTLQDLLLVSLVGNNPERHGFFEVNQAGMQIKLLDDKGQTLAHFHIGKTGPAFTESYVRREGENAVYIANRYLRSSFPPEAKDWRDHTIWNVPPESIEQIQIERAQTPFTLKKEKEKWKLVKPQTVEVAAAKITPLINQLSKILAADFEEESTNKTGLDKPILTIRLVTTSGPLTLFVGKEKEYGQHFGKKEGDDQIYLLRDTLTNAIPKDWRELK